MSFVNWLRGVKAKVDIEPIADGNVILQDNGDGTADLFVDKGNQRLHVIDSTQTSGGHTIWNAIKTALTQRTKLWFADAKVTDDSTEQATKVEVVQLIDDEDELDDAPDGVYQGDYEDTSEVILDASMIAYDEGSVKDALDDIENRIKLVTHIETSDTTIGANSVVDFNVTSEIPSGYYPISVTMERGASAINAMGCLGIVNTAISGSTTTWRIKVLNYHTASASIRPIFTITCIKV